MESKETSHTKTIALLLFFLHQEANLNSFPLIASKKPTQDEFVCGAEAKQRLFC